MKSYNAKYNALRKSYARLMTGIILQGVIDEYDSKPNKQRTKKKDN